MEEPFYILAFWVYDKVEERHGPIAAGIAQLAVGLAMVCVLLAFIALVIPSL